MLLELEQIIVPPGQQLLLKNVTWQMYERILEELGERRASRVNYSQGILEIMTPLPEHENDKVVIGDFIKALLEELDTEFLSLASTTFKNAQMSVGVEADDCFYIENEAAVRGKKRIDLNVDPSPELAIEIDITSRTPLDNYQALGVSELWRWNGDKLEISVLVNGKYVKSDDSRIFPQFPIAQAIPKYLQMSKTSGRNTAMKAFRSWVRERL
jgi:Uma2 family endonuclease